MIGDGKNPQAQGPLMVGPARGPLEPLEVAAVQHSQRDAELYDALETDAAVVAGGMAPDGTVVLQLQIALPPSVVKLPALHLAPSPEMVGSMIVEALGLCTHGRFRLPILKTALHEPPPSKAAPPLDLSALAANSPRVEIKDDGSP